MSIIAQSPGFLQVFSDGSVKRFFPEVSAAASHFSNGYRSKDVTVCPSKPVTARIFFPQIQTSINSLPVIVYFHGGGFCIGSTTWSGYHNFLGGLCVRSHSIVVSINYRLAPENRLPTAYDDCFGALNWLATATNDRTEPWLEPVDLSRVFLSGDSAGGNITHHVAVLAMRLRSTTNDVKIQIQGLLIIHPFFGSEKRIASETTDGLAGFVESNDMLWRLSLPERSDRDHFACNFETIEQPEVEWLNFPSVIVFVAGSDQLMERGALYVEFLRKKGVKEVKMEVAEGQQHVYHVFHPYSNPTLLLQDQMAQFINGSDH